MQDRVNSLTRLGPLAKRQQITNIAIIGPHNPVRQKRSQRAYALLRFQVTALNYGACVTEHADFALIRREGINYSFPEIVRLICVHYLRK